MLIPLHCHPVCFCVLTGANCAPFLCPWLQTPKLAHLKVSQRKITVTEAKLCKEMFAAGSTTLATPILTWDRTTFGAGDVGDYTRMIRRMLYEDMQPKPPHELHTEVDYGVLTYMQ